MKGVTVLSSKRQSQTLSTLVQDKRFSNPLCKKASSELASVIYDISPSAMSQNLRIGRRHYMWIVILVISTVSPCCN